MLPRDRVRVGIAGVLFSVAGAACASALALRRHFDLLVLRHDSLDKLAILGRQGHQRRRLPISLATSKSSSAKPRPDFQGGRGHRLSSWRGTRLLGGLFDDLRFRRRGLDLVLAGHDADDLERRSPCPRLRRQFASPPLGRESGRQRRPGSPRPSRAVSPRGPHIRTAR